MTSVREFQGDGFLNLPRPKVPRYMEPATPNPSKQFYKRPLKGGTWSLRAAEPKPSNKRPDAGARSAKRRGGRASEASGSRLSGLWGLGIRV